MNENEIQRAVFKHLNTRAAPGVFAFHPKNGGIHQRGRRRGINSGLGVVSGVPDVIAIKNGQTYGLELKTDAGRISAEQVATLQKMQEAGAVVALKNGLDAALTWLEEQGLLVGRVA